MHSRPPELFAMATRKMHTFLRPIHYCPDLEDFIAPNVEKM